MGRKSTGCKTRQTYREASRVVAMTKKITAAVKS